MSESIETTEAPEVAEALGMAAAPDVPDVPDATEATEKQCCCRHKNTPRDSAFQADLQKRLNRAIGQLNGVKAMIDDNRYCGDVLIQLAAAESAVHKVSALLLKNHLETCVVEEIQKGNVEIVDEAFALINRYGGAR